MKQIQLHGNWKVNIEGMEQRVASIPGTLDENQIGFPDQGSKQWHPENTLGNDTDFHGQRLILTRLTRKYTYEGPAFYARSFHLPEGAGQERVFLEVERSRELTLSINGQPVPAVVPGTISTPYVFEVTEFVLQGENLVVLCCDNSYPTWPYDAIVFSSAATDETQTNWNGLLGYVRLRFEQRNFISDVRVYPNGERFEAVVELDCTAPWSGRIRVESEAFAEAAYQEVSVPEGRHEVRLEGIPLREGAQRWDEDEGNLYEATADGPGLNPLSVRFGLRTFTDLNGRLALNGRNIFLRSEANCCVFPETGHMPMDVASWKEILSMYRSYGVNCMRFHSHCPPQAAFAAADEMGMMMQPELSHWNPRTAFEDDRSWAYYQMEMPRILLTYANHPSFVMMTWGNELHAGALGHKRMALLLQRAHQVDSTRLFAQGSNNHFGKIGPDPASDFYTSSSAYHAMLRATSANMRGYINEKYPSAKEHFDPVVGELRKEYAGPVFSFEVGQYEVLPDFDECEQYRGITRPDNYLHIRRKVEEAGWLPDWKQRVEATGELSLLAYREEVEAVLRSEALSGISLLSLQDFPGQGTALVGMLNAHLQPKPFPFAQPERFREFFSDVLPLAMLDKYTYLSTETLNVEVCLANYGKLTITEECTVQLMVEGAPMESHHFPLQTYPCGQLSAIGTIAFPLTMAKVAMQLRLVITVGAASHQYPVWVYPDTPLVYPEAVFVTQSVAEAMMALESEKNVFLTPPATEAHFPLSIRAQFTTDFWSVGTFAEQEGFMGCLMDPAHPVFSGFPTEFHSNWQWWPMCQGRAMILPQGKNSLVTALDCYARMRNMGMLLECRHGKGKMVVSSMGLMEQLAYPEVRALLQSILNYMSSDWFLPIQELGQAEIQSILS